MAIGDVFYEVLKFDKADPGDLDIQYLAKITVEDPQNYEITTDVGGALKFTPKPMVSPKVPDAKYELFRDGSMYRIRALRAIPYYHVEVGQLGGLVATGSCLSQKGDAWIGEDCMVRGDCQVSGGAYVSHGSILDGGCYVSGAAQVSGCHIDGIVQIGGDAYLDGCPVETRDGGEVILTGNGRFEKSTFIAEGMRLSFPGGNVNGAHIRRQNELVSAWHSTWGWLSAYPDINGRLHFKIGCQEPESFEALRVVARQFSINAEDMRMLDAFLEMVEVAQGFWTPASKSVEAVEPVPASGETSEAVSLSVPPHIVD